MSSIAALIAVFGATLSVQSCIVSSGAGFAYLNGQQWEASNSNLSYVVPATVPGFIQTDLYNAGFLPDPVYGRNFDQYDWIPQEDWSFTRSLPDATTDGTSWADFEKVFVVFDGIDTAAHISVGGDQVGVADNMFRQWTYDITPTMAKSNKGDRNITVDIFSPIKTALSTLEEIGAPYTRFTNYAEVYPEGREYIRKVQSDFGWDWGPHFAPSGIYRDVYLIGLKEGVAVTNTFIDIYKSDQYPNIEPTQDGPWHVNVSVDFLAAAGKDFEFSTEICGHYGNSTITNTAEGMNTAWLSFLVPEDAVKRWWPHSVGSPQLYEASLALKSVQGSMSKHNNDTQMETPALWTKQVGFRTVTLDLSPTPDGGHNFHFVINGKTINIKGSNLVPLDPFEQLVTPLDYQWLLNSSVASNYNMLRVWSSGNYYGDELYDAADRAGIMLWNEFQFSDNFYPATVDFLANVREEVQYQIRRLNHHPSSSLWCGGNELTKYRKIASKNETHGESWINNLTTIQQQVLWPAVYDNTRSISWLQASDAQGYETYNLSTGYIVPLNETGTPTAGPLEDYNLGLDTVFNNSYLPASRFMVEFGAISYDSYSSFKTVFNASAIQPNGSDLLYRCYDGGNSIYSDTIDGIARYYVLPNSEKGAEDYATSFFWASQIWQGEIIKFKIESYRRAIGLPENDLGALVWQLNAPWTTTALNSIEKTGRWKVLQHLTQQVFEPVAVSSWFEPLNSTYNVWVSSDLWNDANGQVDATWYTWSGNIAKTETWPFNLSSLDSQEVYQASGWGTILPSNSSTDDLVLLLRLSATESNSGKVYRSENYFVPNYVSNSTLVDPGLTVDYLGSSSWKVTATTGVSAYTWLSATEDVVGYFSENSIWLATGESRTVNFTQLSGPGVEQWATGVQVRSLWDNLKV
ncbi:glycoside hydrolase superfamily [Naematelia encephala]|uniref:Beta-mannosidase A n=1 Tax=Naematelia encephala TaxID=71784 RepID=A0A1Y2AHW2_9TREE|nr:glycoside hydrolase superfamily [Naematelia encephala]